MRDEAVVEIPRVQIQFNAVILGHAGHVQNELRLAAYGSRLKYFDFLPGRLRAATLCLQRIRKLIVPGIQAQVGKIGPGVLPYRFINDYISLMTGSRALNFAEIPGVRNRSADHSQQEDQCR